MNPEETPSKMETLPKWPGLSPEKFWGATCLAIDPQISEGTRVFDAVTNSGPFYILPLPLDDLGRVAVYTGCEDRGNMIYSRKWCSALKPVPEPAPKVRDWDQLIAYSLGGVISGVLLMTILAILDLIY